MSELAARLATATQDLKRERDQARRERDAERHHRVLNLERAEQALRDRDEARAVAREAVQIAKGSPTPCSDAMDLEERVPWMTEEER